MQRKSLILWIWGWSSEWARQQLAALRPYHSGPGTPAPLLGRRPLAALCALIFLTALGVRFLHWQDARSELLRNDGRLLGMFKSYQRETQRMLEDGSVLFPRAAVDPGDTTMLVHPPGYSALLLALYQLPGEPKVTLRVLQIFCDALAAILIFLITIELLPIVVGFIAAMLVALSPHLAYYSLWLTPDSLAVLPILLAVFLMVRNNRPPRLWRMILAGGCLGLSCWLRSNSLLLAPFIALAIGLTFPRGQRLRSAATLAVAAFVVIAPITIRNWVVFKSFIPLSLGAGITMIEGIADYDSEDRFGMPRNDEMAALKDAEWHGRPDYADNLWSPDGVARERARFARGLAVVKSHPGWFAGVMLKRAGFMLRYNDAKTYRWPFNTASVPIVAAEPGFGHQLELTEEVTPVWSATPAEMAAGGEPLSPGARVSLNDDATALVIAGNQQLYDDQFATGPIPVQAHHDYLLLVPAQVDQEPMAAKVTSADKRIALVAAAIPQNVQPRRKKEQRRGESVDTLAPPAPDMNVLQLPFASGDRAEVRVVFSNNGASSATMVQVGQVRLYDLGLTPQTWSRYPRGLVHNVQKNLFVTNRLLPLVGLGLGLLALAGYWRALILLLAVPAYYLLTHSLLHTEYRYTLGIHYFLFVASAVTLVFIGAALWQAALWCRDFRAHRRDRFTRSGTTDS